MDGLLLTVQYFLVNWRNNSLNGSIGSDTHNLSMCVEVDMF